jgi:hypothetical protein
MVGDFFLTRDALVVTFPSYALGLRAILAARLPYAEIGELLVPILSPPTQ